MTLYIHYSDFDPERLIVDKYENFEYTFNNGSVKGVNRVGNIKYKYECPKCVEIRDAEKDIEYNETRRQNTKNMVEKDKISSKILDLKELLQKGCNICGKECTQCEKGFNGKKKCKTCNGKGVLTNERIGPFIVLFDNLKSNFGLTFSTNPMFHDKINLSIKLSYHDNGCENLIDMFGDVTQKCPRDGFTKKFYDQVFKTILCENKDIILNGDDDPLEYELFLTNPSKYSKYHISPIVTEEQCKKNSKGITKKPTDSAYKNISITYRILNEAMEKEPEFYNNIKTKGIPAGSRYPTDIYLKGTSITKAIITDKHGISNKRLNIKEELKEYINEGILFNLFLDCSKYKFNTKDKICISEVPKEINIITKLSNDSKNSLVDIGNMSMSYKMNIDPELIAKSMNMTNIEEDNNGDDEAQTESTNVDNKESKKKEYDSNDDSSDDEKMN